METFLLRSQVGQDRGPDLLGFQGGTIRLLHLVRGAVQSLRVVQQQGALIVAGRKTVVDWQETLPICGICISLVCGLLKWDGKSSWRPSAVTQSINQSIHRSINQSIDRDFSSNQIPLKRLHLASVTLQSRLIFGLILRGQWANFQFHLFKLKWNRDSKQPY